MDARYFKEDGNRTKLDGQYFYDNITFTLPYLVVMIVSLILGTLGNTLIIGTVITSRTMRTIGNIFIVNLAFADLVVAVIVDTFSIVGIKYGEVFFEDKYTLCIVISSICLTTCYCSLLSIGGISFNRMVHICYNEYYQKLFTYKTSLATMFGFWLISFLLQLPTLVGWGDHSYDKKTMTCVVDRTASFSYSAFWAFFGILTPWSLTSACYLKLLLHVRASKRKIRQMADKDVKQPNDRAGRARNESMKLMKTLFIIFIVFTLCWTPYAILLLIDFEDKLPKELHATSVILAHFNSSVNCILYGLTNSQFRKGYKRFLLRVFCRSKFQAFVAEETVITMNPRTINVPTASRA